MSNEHPVYMGPRLRRMRRDLGLTQANMAADLDISPSYIALLERNQRPLTADMLLRLARTYRLDLASLGTDGHEDTTARLQAVLRDPIFADIDVPALEATDIVTGFPGITEAFLRLHTAWREEHLALADRDAETPGSDTIDPVAEARRFLAARRNNFPALDDAAQGLAAAIADAGGLVPYFKARHALRVRRLPPDVMGAAIRRFDRHRDEVLLDDSLDNASQSFQLALQLAWLELRAEIDAPLATAGFHTEGGQRLAQKALASYAAAAVMMPYAGFARTATSRHYDIEALGRAFGASFEQVAHRLTTLQKPGDERVPFFFLRIDPAGNVSKRLDGAGFPFARHGGACPLWAVHQAFRRPREIITQWLELPDGQRFFSIARSVTAGGGAFGAPRVERAIALGCSAEHASKLVYTMDPASPGPDSATPIGVTCHLCHRTRCTARSAPPIGRTVLPDDFRRASAPFGFSEV